MMLHHLLDKGPWFRAKRFGYGAGLPFKWQGWVFMFAHLGLIIGLALALEQPPMMMLPLVLFAAFAPMPIYAARTEGGWKWRMDGKEEN